jgi:hypothetical protein
LNRKANREIEFMLMDDIWDAGREVFEAACLNHSIHASNATG